MSEESPPTYTTPIFNQAYFGTTDGEIDTAYLNSHYLRYPIAQTGLETIANLATTNDATINGLTVGKGKNSIATNTAVGINALAANTTGTENTAVGDGALESATTAAQNTAVGYEALFYTTISGTSTAVGFHAARNASGTNNLAIGYRAFRGTAGTNAGIDNIAIGSDSLFKLTSGNKNIAIGIEALYNSTGTTDNVAIGYKALHETPGANNTAVGNNALNATTGTNNTGIGTNAGNNNTTGSNNTYVGYNALPSATNYSNSTALGAGATITSSNMIMLGTASEKVYLAGQSTYPLPYIIASGSFISTATATAGRVLLGTYTKPATYSFIMPVVSNGDGDSNSTTFMLGASVNNSGQVYINYINATYPPNSLFRANYIIYAIM